MSYSLLLVEDDKRMQEIIEDYFLAQGSKVTSVDNGVLALEQLKLNSYDLVLLDIMIPKLDGFSVCKRIREDKETPIIFLTAKNDEYDKLYGYEIGADDYVTKPFSLAVLHAKCMALLKRAWGKGVAETLQAGEIKIEVQSHKVFICKQELILPNLEYKLLSFFIRNQNRVITREQLLDRIWGDQLDVSDRVVDSHVKKLRKAMGQHSNYLETVRKMGYRFEVKGK